MTDIKVPEDLWATSIMPEGTLERWLLDSGSQVQAGEAVAQVLIENCLHDIRAPLAGILSHGLGRNGLLEPGSTIGEIAPST